MESVYELNDTLKGVYLPQQMPGNPNDHNPSLMPPYNPWEGQGTVIDTGAPRSTPNDAPGGSGFWTGFFQAAPTLFCLVAPKSKGCQRQADATNTINGANNQPTTNNQPTWMLFFGALITLLLLILIFKK